MADPITEACRRVRDDIVQRSGGFEGYFDQLEELDRKRLAAEPAKKAPKKPKGPPGKQGRKRPDAD